jgi:hypothetical protein
MIVVSSANWKMVVSSVERDTISPRRHSRIDCNTSMAIMKSRESRSSWRKPVL